MKDYTEKGGLDIDINNYTYEYSLDPLTLVFVANVYFVGFVDIEIERDEKTGNEELGTGDETFTGKAFYYWCGFCGQVL